MIKNKDVQFYKEIAKEIIKKKPSKKQLNRIKNRLCKKHKTKIPTDIQILLNADQSDVPKIKKYLLTKPTRTISGVAVCAIMTKPSKCPHGKCSYCPGGPDSYFGNVPQSYTGKEPATRRAIRNKYDPYLQVMNRLEQYIVQGHTPEKIELIIMGGTFPSLNTKYQEKFVAYALKAMNDFSSMFYKRTFSLAKFKEFFELPGDIFDKERTELIQRKLLKIKKKADLAKEKLRNEKSKIRCVAVCIETRPDYATLKHANQMLKLGATRVELGVQSIYDDVLKRIKRGHNVRESIKATKILRNLGFKITYQMMPGLPGVNKKKDLFGLIALFQYDEFQPDMLKIYPCMVLKGTNLYKLWKKKKYSPLTTKQAAEIIAEFKAYVPPYVRISRVQRDIPTFLTEAGVDKTNLRQYIEKLTKKKKIKCQCIRCREAGIKLKNRPTKLEISLKLRHYIASEGNEFFISAEDTKKNILLGLCRLRFPSSFQRRETTEDSALIRELHVYGPAAAMGKKGKIQHKGIGKKLLKKAEETCRDYYKKKLVIISGIGVREYYKRLGYKKEGPYMVKHL